MNILLAGCSGFVGSHLKQALLKAGHDVTCIDRHHGVDFLHMQQEDDWKPYVHNVEIVINAVGIIVETSTQKFPVLHQLVPIALFQASVKAGVRRIIQVSALGADTDAMSQYHKTKRTADDYLKSLAVEWFILKPSLIYGEGGKSYALVKQLAKLPLLPLIEGGRQKISPVHVTDLVETICQCLKVSQSNRVLNVVGPDIIMFVDWLRLIRRKYHNKSLQIISIPFSLGMLASHIFHYVFPMIHPDNIRMLNKGNSASASELSQFLERKPRSVEEML